MLIDLTMPLGLSTPVYPGDPEVEVFAAPGKVIDIREPTSVDLSSVEPGDIVLLYTGFSETYTASDYYERDPKIPVEIALELVKLNIKAVGIDAGSIDTPPLIHKTLLRGDVLIIENIVNMRTLTGRKFEVLTFPLNVELEASPVRMVARTVA